MANTVSLLDIVNEAEKFSPRTNMISACRLLEIGNYLGLKQGHTVIDCGCGHGEVLCLWAKYFGTSGLGVDSDASAIANASALAEREGLSDKVEFAQSEMGRHDTAGEQWDVAVCLGSTMCFGGFDQAVRELKKAIVPEGKIVVSEAFFTTHDVPDELKEYEGDEPTETELFDMVRAAGCRVGYYSRASRGEWERYIFHTHKVKTRGNMSDGEQQAKVGPDRWQDMYLRYRQKWQGIAIMTVHPA
jgi:cyclopropane fatty-acyl-phospholipid synthase-like methyltransferase